LHGNHSHDYYHHIGDHIVETYAKFTLHNLLGVGCQDAVQHTEEGQRENPLQHFPTLWKLQLGQLVLTNVVMDKPFNEEYQKGS
jgi:hypothetical protein